jgi:predicted RNA-binding protein with RPS1 domain
MNLKDIAKIKKSTTSEIVDYLNWKGVTIQDAKFHELLLSEIKAIDPFLYSVELEKAKSAIFQEGDIVEGVIQNVADFGVFVDFYNGLTGLLHISQVSNDKIENLSSLFSKGQAIRVLIKKVREDGKLDLGYKQIPYILIKKRQEEKEKIIAEKKIARQEALKERQAKAKLFTKQFHEGTVFPEAEVIKVGEKRANIKVDEYEGLIDRDNLNWNVISSAKDLLYVGEVVNVVFIGVDDDYNLKFGLKQLNDKPYEDYLYDYSIDQLLKIIGINDNLFIGEAVSFGDHKFLVNLRSDSKEKGVLLADPFYGQNIRAVVNVEGIESGSFYRTKLRLISKELRLERNQLFQFQTNRVEKVDNPYKEDVESVFRKNISPATNLTVSHLLAEVGKNLYSSKDRMFFELIQNADDASAQKGVNVKIRTIGDYLVVKHNGFAFSKDDFEAITSAANGTKKANENKTGYKGIGFKSVFTDSEEVIIFTGGYKFKFDRNEPIFNNFEDFYFKINNFATEQQKLDFLRTFQSEKKKFDGVKDIPWQLEPIWTEQLPGELKASDYNFEKSNVAIALKLSEERISGDDGYEKAILGIIGNPKFMLFLRNTLRIDFNDETISKHIKDNKITLKNSHGLSEQYERKDYEIPVNNEAFEKSGIDLKISIVETDENNRVKDAKFVNSRNAEYENIPPKIAVGGSTQISFAAPYRDNMVTTITEANHGTSDISLFAFLPTLVKDFIFPFYINANFVLDSPRQRILGDNPWNFYLMQNIGRSLVEWVAELSKNGDNNCLWLLPISFFDEKQTDTGMLAKHFNSEYKDALKEYPFILDHNGELSKQEEIIIDHSGLSDIIGANLLCRIIDSEKRLPSPHIDITPIKDNKDFFSLVERCYSGKTIVEHLTKDCSLLNNWLINEADDEKRNQFFEWFLKKKDKTAKIIEKIKLFQVKGEWLSIEEISLRNNIIITTSKTQAIYKELEKLGYICTDVIVDNHPLNELVSKYAPSGKSVFATIAACDFSVLDFDERKHLFIELISFDGVGESKLKDLVLFKNALGKLSCLKAISRRSEKTQEWFLTYCLDENEYFPELDKYILQEDNVFEEIVVNHYDEIIKSTSLTDLYKIYETVWPDSFTQNLIKKGGLTIEILPIIENSGTRTKELFLQSITLNLNVGEKYDESSPKTRIIKMAISVYGERVKAAFSNAHIQINGKPLTLFTYSDEVSCAYKSVGENKVMKLSLAELNPEYRGLSNVINEISEQFAGLTASELKKNVFALEFIGKQLLFEQICDLKKCQKDGSMPIMPTNLNASQMLYFIWYRRDKTNWNNRYYDQSVYNNYFRRYEVQKRTYSGLWDENWVPMVNLQTLDSSVFDNLMSICMKEKVNFYQLSFFKTIVGKFLSNSYILQEEQINTVVEKWAKDGENCEEKLSYLKSIGVKDETENLIKFRKGLIDGIEQKCSDYNLQGDELVKTLEWLTSVVRENPIEKKEAKNAVISILLALKNANYAQYVIEDFKIAKEWDDKRYYQWKKSHNLSVYVIDSEMPYRCIYNQKVLFKDKIGDYAYFDSLRRLYINEEKSIQIIMGEICDITNIPFSKEDWNQLFLVSRDEILEKEKEILELKQQLLKQNELLLANEQQVVEKGNLSKEEQEEISRNARVKAKQYLANHGYDVSRWDAEKSIADVYSEIITPQGETINIVIRSARGKKIHLAATSFEILMSNPNNLLLVDDGKEIRCVDFEELFGNNSNVNLIFDAQYTPREYFEALAKIFKYVRNTQFVIENPQYSAFDEIKGFGLEVKNKGTVVLGTEEDI